MRFLLLRFATLSCLLAPALASAHEVYVLSPDQIRDGLAAPSFSWLSVALADMHSFAFWGAIAIGIVLMVFGISIFRPLEKACLPFLDRIKKYAPHITRITVGLSFLASAFYQAAYGPELPLARDWGSLTVIISAVLVILGIMMILGIQARLAALVALLLFAYSIVLHGAYMLTYANYLGEFIVLLLMGAHGFRGTHAPMKKGGFSQHIARLGHRFKPYAFLVLRITFGTSLLYASYYAKFLHNDLAYQVASLPLGHAGSLAQVLGFEPHFLVMGAGIVEFVLAFFFILGIEIRYTSLFVLFWVSLSVYYFGESVWPHLILIGIPLAFVVYGYDKYSLEGRFFKKRLMEPVL